MAAILMTGATGFLGSKLLKRFLLEGREVVVLKRSFSNAWRIEQDSKQAHVYDIDRVDLETVFANHAIEVVVHTATNYGRKGQSAALLVQDNVLFPLQLLENAVKYDVERFINTDTFFNNSELNYNYLNNYVTGKRHFLDWCKIVSSAYRIKLVNMKVYHMYGPGDDDTKFVTWILRQLLQEVESIPLTAGTQKRDFVYVDDVVEAYWAVLQHNQTAPYSEYEVGSGTSVSIKDMVECAKSLLEQKLNRPLRIQLRFGEVPMREGEPVEIRADISSLLHRGWRPLYSLEKGIWAIIK